MKWESDYPYHPDNVQDAYLSTNLMDRLFEEIKQVSTRYEEILLFIKLHEDTHRQVLLGLLSQKEAADMVEKAAEQYRSRYCRWVHLEPEYNSFYRLVNRDNWR